MYKSRNGQLHYNKKINKFQHAKCMVKSSDDNFWTRVYDL